MQLDQSSQCHLAVRHLRSDSTILDVVASGMLNVRDAKLSDRQFVEGHIERALHVVRDNLVVATTGFLGAVFARFDGLPVDSHTGLPSDFVEGVLQLWLFHGLRFPKRNG
jgi:hypothetical protein